MKKLITDIREMKEFLLLWLSQSFSGLGTAVTSYALVIWSYTQHGSALVTALLMVCSYTPYVLCSIFAGALSDRWDKKKTMLICDSLAAICSLAVLILLKTEQLRVWHLYVLNALSGLMNTVQQPASEVAITAMVPKKHYQKTSALWSMSDSLRTILTPVIATAMIGLFGMDAVVLFDLFTFAVAFLTLLFGIHLPRMEPPKEQQEPVLQAAKYGLRYLKEHRGVLDLILFLAAINLVASMYEAALPAMMLSREGGGQQVMGAVNMVIGISTLVGSLLTMLAGEPKSRVRVICNALLVSMSTENFLLAFGRSGWIWCAGGFLGWLPIPLMNANMGVLLRTTIPIEIQGRVYAARNTLQYFTIPVGYLLGGVLVDQIFEPIMAVQNPGSVLLWLFGSGKGTGAAFFFLVLAVTGIAVCVLFRRDKHIWALENGHQL